MLTRHRIVVLLCLVVTTMLVVFWTSGCGGDNDNSVPFTSDVVITSPSAGATVTGNTDVTATIDPTANVTGVNFSVNGTTFATVPGGSTATARLDTLGVGLANGPATITVTTSGAKGTDTQQIIVNNPRALFVRNTSAPAGDVVNVRVGLNDLGNASNARFTLTWDPNRLQFISPAIFRGAAVPESTSLGFTTPTSGRLDVELTGDQPFIAGQRGELLVARFKIIGTPPAGTAINVGISNAELSTATGVNVPVTDFDGQVIVTEFGSQVSVR